MFWKIIDKQTNIQFYFYLYQSMFRMDSFIAFKFF